MRKSVILFAATCLFTFASCDSPAEEQAEEREETLEDMEDRAEERADELEELDDDYDTTAVIE